MFRAKSKPAERPKDIPSRLALSASLDIEAAQAKDGEGPAPKFFNIIANTGVPMRLEGFFDPVVIDLTGARFLKKRTKVIADHKPHLRVGMTTEQAIDTNSWKITARAQVLPNNKFAQAIAVDAQDGFDFETSVGADIEKAYHVDEGQKVSVNGREFKGPLIVASKTKIREITVTSFGADSNTSAKLAASAPRMRLENQMKTTDAYQTWLDELKATAGLHELSAEQEASFKILYAKKPAKAQDEEEEDEAEASEDDEEEEEASAKRKAKSKAKSTAKASDINAQREAAANEEDRCDQIKATAKRYGLESDTEVTVPKSLVAKYPSVKAKMTISAVKSAAIKSGMTPDEFELVCEYASMPKPVEFRGGIHTQNIDASLQGQVLSCAVQMSTGAPAKKTNSTSGVEYGYETQYDAKVLEAAHKMRHVTLHQLMDITIKASTGFTFEGNRKSQEFLKAAYAADKQIRAAGQSFSTLSVANVLEDAANKRLLSMYQQQEVVWPFFTAEASLTDFKVHNVYRLDQRSRYKKLGDAGEIKHGSFSDAKYTLQAETFAVLIGLTRQQMINDDLGAFNAIPDSLGALAAVAIESEFFVMLLGNANSFFHSSNGNLQTGGGTALAIAGLTAAELAFSNQVTVNGDPILVSPDRLLVGTQHYVTARTIYDSVKLVSTDAASTPESNPHAGKYLPYKSPYMNNTAVKNHQSGAAITGQDSTHWYLFANPAQLAAFNVGFLNGQKTPVLESADSDFSTLGMQWRSYHDWALGQGDPKGVQKMAGT